ncbi:MAG: (Fe-S)-binding protein, partial [Deltaproteobacteria bacterium]|nr:(Fe-S)-binding protein [Deltaproteobacteria bacterium]
DQIIAPCASCASMLKLDYPLLFEEGNPFRERVLAFSAKVSDASKFLAGVIPKGSGEDRGKKVRVTYHDPCHLRRKLGIFKEPRDLLQSIPGVEYVEMQEANRCCGQGGSFNIANYDLSLNILDHKMKAIEDTGASIVATACSGCLLQLMDGVHQKGLKVDVRHLLEMFDQATLL